MMTDSSLSLSRLRKQRTILLETRKRDGTWVATPVSVAVDDDGRAFFRTYNASGKHKRLRNFPEVRIAPATTVRGRPTGPARTATAHRVTGASEERARDLLVRKYPLLHGHVVPWQHRRRGWTTLHYELRLDD